MYKKGILVLLAVCIIIVGIWRFSVVKENKSRAYYNEKQNEMAHIISELSQDLERLSVDNVYKENYSAVVNSLYKAKEKIIIVTQELEKTSDFKTDMQYKLIHKVNVLILYLCKTVGDEENQWNEEYFKMAKTLISRINEDLIHSQSGPGNKIDTMSIMTRLEEIDIFISRL